MSRKQVLGWNEYMYYNEHQVLPGVIGKQDPFIYLMAQDDAEAISVITDRLRQHNAPPEAYKSIQVHELYSRKALEIMRRYWREYDERRKAARG